MLVVVLFAVLFCLHAFQFTSIEAENIHLSLPSQQVFTDSYQPAKTAIQQSQNRIRTSSSLEVDDEPMPIFDLIHMWGFQQLLSWLSGLCFVWWIVINVLARQRYFLPERYWNLRNFSYRFSHTRN